MIRSYITFLIIAIPLLSCEKNMENNSDTAINIDEIQVEGGIISGSENADQSVYSFKGIPYAKAPVGDLRWKPPAPVEAWSGIKECTSFGASAIQPSPEPFYMWSEEFLIPKEPIDEDCLFLNVWTSAKTTSAKQPVMVWIHGGGYSSGGSSVPIYDGEALAKKGIVYVSINYRVGILGFFSHPELSEESEAHASGNYGLMDQIAALKWVKNNIEQFGGDPDNVTIAGQSAGGASVVYLVASPRAKDLFQKAIVQSGRGLLGDTPDGEKTELIDLEDAEEKGREIAEKAGYNSIDSLRKLPAGELAQQLNQRWLPVLDGHVLSESAFDIYKQNRQNKVKLLTGWNEDEGLMFRAPENANQFRNRIASEWDDAAEELLGYYPATNDSIAAISQQNLQRDILFGAQNFLLADLVSGNGETAYVYRFTRRVPPGEYEDFGAFHTAEVPYALGNLEFFKRPFETVDLEVAGKMSSYWVNFVKSGDPNGADLPKWPEYNSDSYEIMFFGDQVMSGAMKDSSSLKFLSKTLAVQ